MINSIKNFLNQRTGLLIRIDDVAENMNWSLMDKCEALFDQYNIKPLLGVIPLNADKALYAYEKNNNFWNKVREWQKKGWEISMHGLSHVYDMDTNKKDYFNYGGRSEFFGHDYQIQFSRIKKGLEKFKEEKINIRSFFAPNHTYDKTTFVALNELGVKHVIDGYGLIPYTENNINFFPQAFLPSSRPEARDCCTNTCSQRSGNFPRAHESSSKPARSFQGCLGCTLS